MRSEASKESSKQMKMQQTMRLEASERWMILEDGKQRGRWRAKRRIKVCRKTSGNVF